MIDTGLPGETNQCLGIANVLQCRTSIVALRLRSKHLGPLFKAAMHAGIFASDTPRWLTTAAYRLLFSGPPLNGAKPDVTLSTLGRGEVPAIFLRQFYGTFAINIGVPRRTPSALYDLVIRLPAQQTESLDCPSITVDIAPTPILLEQVKAFSSPLVTQWKSQSPRICAVLIGGDGGGYKYRPDEWRNLANGLAALASNQQVGILLTTSRRTGTVAEREFKSNASLKQNLLHAVWFGSKEPNPMSDYLAAADFIICTEESRSMISDAVAAGKCVYTVRPQCTTTKDVRLLELLSNQESLRRIKRIEIDRIAELDLAADAAGYFRPRAECWSVKPLREIRRLLALRQQADRQDNGSG